MEVRRRLADGRLGTIISMVGQHTTSTGQFIAADNWRAQPEEAPGGAITAVGVHSIDHMIEFAGPVRDVLCSTGRYVSGPSDDTSSIMLRFEGGATGPALVQDRRRPGQITRQHLIARSATQAMRANRSRKILRARHDEDGFVFLINAAEP